MKDHKERVELGTRLKEAREYRGFSQEDVAKYLGVPRSAISLFENGVRRLDILELRKLSRVYKCSVDELTGEQQSGADEPSSAKMLARAAVELSEEDRSELLRFVQFLKSRKKGET